MGDAIVRWASTGGGWRSMIACMGFGNLFHRAGLLPPLHNSSSAPHVPPPDPDGSGGAGSAGPPPLSAVSTTSGSSWYSLQLFYSPQFYDGTVSVSSEGLRDFVYLWWDSYGEFITASEERINLLQGRMCDSFASDANENAICKVALAYGGDWAAFMDEMLRTASVAYKDEGFHARAADEGGRVAAVEDVTLSIVSALSPTSRSGAEGDVVTYLGPNATMEGTYTATIPAAYVVTDADSSPARGWWYGAGDADPGEGDDGSLFCASSADTDDDFTLGDWDHYYYYQPGVDGQLLIPTEGLVAGNVTPFREAFAGATTVVQAASASSAFLGEHSPVIPSVFAQTLSLELEAAGASAGASAEEELVEDVGGTEATEGGDGMDALYDAQLLFGLAVCSRWPAPCGASDSHFIDGMGADASGLAQVIGQYHSSPDADLSAPFRVLLTNTNSAWDEYDRQLIALHYRTGINAGVAPGDFLWAPVYNKQPVRSFQVFEEMMDESAVESLLEAVGGSNMTTARLAGTTVDNPAYRVRAGQRVEALLINTNADIPTLIAAPDLIEELRAPMGDMAVGIAANPTLLARVRAFLNATGEEGGGADVEQDDADGYPTDGADEGDEAEQGDADGNPADDASEGAEAEKDANADPVDDANEGAEAEQDGANGGSADAAVPSTSSADKLLTGVLPSLVAALALGLHW